MILNVNKDLEERLKEFIQKNVTITQDVFFKIDIQYINYNILLNMKF